jgi:hypothetical protein
VLEQHLGCEARQGQQGAEIFVDSIGIGSYHIDLHPSTGDHNYVDISLWPFQIPLGALIPRRVENLLSACKNMGTTHITNGSFREHPIEWNIGEAAWCLEKKLHPRQVRQRSAQLAEFQRLLQGKLGFQVRCYEAARLTPLTSW